MLAFADVASAPLDQESATGAATSTGAALMPTIGRVAVPPAGSLPVLLEPRCAGRMSSAATPRDRRRDVAGTAHENYRNRGTGCLGGVLPCRPLWGVEPIEAVQNRTARGVETLRQLWLFAGRPDVLTVGADALRRIPRPWRGASDAKQVDQHGDERQHDDRYAINESWTPLLRQSSTGNQGAGVTSKLTRLDSG